MYDLGDRNKDRTTSSMIWPLRFKYPTCSVLGASCKRSFEGNRLLTMEKVIFPLSLITPMAPMPGGVANATMVSSQPDK